MMGEQNVKGPLLIGTTGHRDLIDEPELISSLDEALGRILDQFSPQKVIVLSPLAEGADRLIFQRVKELRSDAVLHVILPLEIDDYIEDFLSDRSKIEFIELLEEAETIDIITTSRKIRKKQDTFSDEGPGPDLLREISYEACGHLMVDMCSILVALWDGQKARGRGGTGEVVNYARNRQRPIIWVNVKDDHRINYERLDIGSLDNL